MNHLQRPNGPKTIKLGPKYGLKHKKCQAIFFLLPFSTQVEEKKREIRGLRRISHLLINYGISMQISHVSMHHPFTSLSSPSLLITLGPKEEQYTHNSLKFSLKNTIISPLLHQKISRFRALQGGYSIRIIIIGKLLFRSIT